ncbi:hypothetical protein F3N42_07455 [Marinihelvus fidelis]|uniref:Uncharacterized protein n=1 Tax=Marinihelvus fidelis TaxID=2613842 RepID=A0A5N0TBE5_9GAMM|nr:hypothetical protein [Marinihelvus fidelis]KAA9131998.1 hypothetical protein F3N42_07455 [Marinihelvus fidelis]
MANGKPHDNPLSDLVIHGMSSFPAEMESLLLQINELGRMQGRFPLGENWPFSHKEFDWAKGRAIDAGMVLLQELLEKMQQGQGDDVLLNPITQRPLSEG